MMKDPGRQVMPVHLRGARATPATAEHLQRMLAITPQKPKPAKVKKENSEDKI
jgi:hypothetical protein